MLEFFDKIEHEEGAFRVELFNQKFRPIVQRHEVVLLRKFEEIFNQFKGFSQEKKSSICAQIKHSNEIEKICSREVEPLSFNSLEDDFFDLVRELFLNLYNKVLNGEIAKQEIGMSLRNHFDQFRTANEDITDCPMCGISPLKSKYDKSRDQYDHYLPKAIYPLSSVNFKNLVPTCLECNSFNAKGDCDVIDSTGGRKIFYPYDQNYHGLEIKFSIIDQDHVIENLDWNVCFDCQDDREDEIESWKAIYKIEERYIGHVKGKITKWFKTYWSFMQKRKSNNLSTEDNQQAYFDFLEADEQELINMVRKPALQEFLRMETIIRALEEV
ncbi:MAG: hypothetical protein KDI92_00220 [Xanthomonadales bacterium]|nr:hypothetical protein [Xanthomonadales bacterium]